MMPALMIRTSVYLPEDLHQRLLIASKRRGKSFSILVRELVEQSLQGKEKADLARIYDAWDKVQGVGKDDITDASTTIDEILYGDSGAWRGSGK
jgi:predicted DNA-binding protein